MYKDIFRGAEPASLAVRDKPAMSRLRRVDDLEGVKSIFPIRVHLHPGMAADFATVQTNETTNDIYRFELQPKDQYAVVCFNAKAMAASRSNVGSYLRLKAKEIQDVLEYAGQKFEKMFWRGGEVGSVTAAPSNVSGSTYRVTLADATDIVNIHKGMVIGCYDDNTGGAATKRAETGTVTVVDHANGTFDATFTGNPSAWGTNTDYLYVEGDRSGTTISTWTGVQQYIPSSAPSSGESFQGLDRSPMPNYLAGWRGTQYATNEESLQQLAVTMAPFLSAIKGKSEIWMHPKAFHVTQAEAGARLVRDQGEGAVLGYTKCKLASAMGDIPIMTGPFCPKSTAFMLDWSTWSLHTLKPLLHLINEDGNEILRKAAADEFEMRWRSWAELLCDEPVKNGRVAVNT
jgi:hypothetical protein